MKKLARIEVQSTRRTEVILAQEKVQTDRERAVADRSLEMAVKRVKEAGEVAEANAAFCVG